MHFSKHQLNGDSETAMCALCGKPGHMPVLSRTGAKWEFPESCFFAGNTLNVKKVKKIECSFPFSNHPMECPECNDHLWRFDFANHFQKKHPGKTCPPQGVVSEAEKVILARKKITAKKALNKKDLDKMSDDELLLLPLKNFWNRGKKEWEKNVAGNFGKQNSEQMKKLFGTNKFN